ncbi:MAG: MBL fold metallo-hydrolase [Myxococcota bacterium]
MHDALSFPAVGLATFVATLALSACTTDDGTSAPITRPTPTEQTRTTGATVRTYDYGSLRIHAYSNDEAHVNTGNYLIEGPTGIVIVDVSFQADVAQDLAAFADELGKPIERIILTHDHPDHWLGITYDALANVPVHATQATIDSIAGPAGDQFFGLFTSGARNLFGDPPPAKRAPDQALPEGEETIDGIRYEYTTWQDIEAADQVAIYLPDYDVWLAGDLVYHEVHPVVSPVFDAWRDALATMEAASTSETLVLPGHGEPGTIETYEGLAQYLDEAEAAFADVPGPDSWSFTMLQRYPEFLNGPFLVPLSASILYGGTMVSESAPLSAEPWPESIELHDQRIYASNWVRGGIRYIDLRNPDAGTQTFVEPDPEFPAFWGLTAERATNRLWALANAGSFGVEGPAQLRAYDAITAERLETIELPAGTLANDLTIGPDGSIYITDVSANARVIRVGPGRDVDAAWLQDASAWPAVSGFGLGGLAFANEGIYVSAEGALWFAAVGEDGSAGSLRAVELDTACDVDPQTEGVQLPMDGLSTDGQGNLFGAFNDVTIAGANGILMQLKLSTPTTAGCTPRLEGLADPSGVTVGTVGFASYVLVAESQFGFLDSLGPIDTGMPSDPWSVRILPL